jgi:peptidoglycan/xylan/chitin deacetylase (PgdA/CDA1 family)
MSISEFIIKIQRKWMNIRLQPIRVFCLHHVCEHFDADAMYACDWMALDEFKRKINVLQDQGYEFISLNEACEHLQNDYIRRKKYAVLTFDDGYKSLLEVLSWLEKQQIPATLFINGKYLDGKSYRETSKEQYLTYDELFTLTSPLIEIGHHGWEHTAADTMTNDELMESLFKNEKILSSHPHHIPFWAYTWGRHNKHNDELLQEYEIIPILVEGNKNYKWIGTIDREVL